MDPRDLFVDDTPDSDHGVGFTYSSTSCSDSQVHRPSVSAQAHGDSFSSQPTTALAILRELRPLLERRALAPARRCGVQIDVLGLMPMPQLPSVRRAKDGAYWLFSDYLHDAGLQQDGFLAVPAAELRRLTMLRDAGLLVDDLLIAHELPRSWTPGTPLPAIVPGAPQCTELDQRFEAGIRTTSQAIAQTAARIVDKSAVVASTVANAVGKTIVLDPAILGTIRHQSEPTVCCWLLLAKWAW